MNSFLDYDFNEKIRDEIVKRNINIKTLSNQEVISPWTNNSTIVKNHWIQRYINPNILNLNLEMLIYDDVYVIYNYDGEDVFCIEIYNQKLAQIQTQIFDALWEQSQEMEVLDSHGSARVKL